VRVAAFLCAVCAAGLAIALAGCGTGGYTSGGSQGNGKKLFTLGGCGGCHTLADAGTAGTIGPDLDDAFAQARVDGLTTGTFEQVVAAQIKFPVEETSTGARGMPGVDTTLPSCGDVNGDVFCVKDQDDAVADVAAYVAAVAGTGVTAETPMDGKTIFTASCGGCHTLADAGTGGTIGPNLDQSKPSKALAVDRVTNGQGVMPPFKDSLDAAQIEAVAEYVSSAAGR